MNQKYKFKWIYNTKSNRLENYDYSSNWWYFITICTKDREKHFGKIHNQKMVLNEYGKIVFDEIQNIKNYNNFTLVDEFIVMPDHLHLIILLNKNQLVETSIYGVSYNDVLNNDVSDNGVSHNDVSKKRNCHKWGKKKCHKWAFLREKLL